MDDLLPIGSVIKTNGPRNLMIIGYYPSKPTDEKFYDYICCRTRLGLVVPNKQLVSNKNYFFVNNDDIKDVLYIGLQSKEYEFYKKILKELKNKVLEVKKNNISEAELVAVYNDFINGFAKKGE